MENHAHDPVIILKVEFGQEEYSEILEKQLLRIDGIDKVTINRAKEEVTIIGYIDPLKLVKHIAKSGRRVELLLYDQKPKTSDKKHYKDARDSGQTSKEREFGCPCDHPQCRMNDSFHREHHHQAGKKAEEERDPYDEYRAAGKGDQNGHDFNGGCGNNEGFVPPRTNQGAKYQPRSDHRSQCDAENYTHHKSYGATEDMNRGGPFVPPMKNQGAKYQPRHDHHSYYDAENYTHHKSYRAAEEMNRDQYDGPFVPPWNSKAANFSSFPEGHPHRAAAANKERVNEEETRPGQFQGRARNEGMCGNPRGQVPHMMEHVFPDENIEEVIQQARKEMDNFFSIRRRGAMDNCPGDSSGQQHVTPRRISQEPLPGRHYDERNLPPAFQQHHERMPVSPPPPPPGYRGRHGPHYDKYTNLFSDENPSACTIV